MDRHFSFRTPGPLPSFQRGGALVIVLAFIVLLTGLAVAFFSRAAGERRVSNRSASQTKTELFAQGAADQILGDLKQEILAGSNLSPSRAGGVVYLPATHANAVPALSGTADYTGNCRITSFAPNLIKRSAYGEPFYSGPGFNHSYPGISRASRVSSAGTSRNGRHIPPARWNKALLLPKDPAANFNTNDTDFTPATTGANAFIPPDWILVARNGGTPVQTSPGAPADIRWSETHPSTVVGRYAFAIYDEGGILDANVAGAMPALAGGADLCAYKAGLPFADLTKVTGTEAAPNANSTVFKGLPAAQARNFLNNLAGWRSYASLQATGALSSSLSGASYTPGTGVTGTTYYNLVTSNTTGFLTTGTAVHRSQTDRMFTSRQQLIRWTMSLAQGSGATAKTERNYLQNTLQYFTHFSRALDQPSFVPNPTRPKVQPIASGGNDAFQSRPVDDPINPSFLSVRAAGVFVRHDGSQASAGDPLVIRRFPLNRLAWLTCEGPSSKASSATQTALLHAGIPRTLIDQGDDARILAWFGLSWDGLNRRWIYLHGLAGRIMTLAEVAGAADGKPNREPDFFELLKAGIAVGSVGKAYNYDTFPDPETPLGYQQRRDNSADAQVIQIGANIIDQSDGDGFPTQIACPADPVGASQNPRIFHGVEDLPYLYRVREGKIAVRDSNPAQDKLPKAPAAASALKDAGFCVVLQEPEIWNPHAWSASKPDAGPRPAAFRIVAISTHPGAPISAAEPLHVILGNLAWDGTVTNNPNSSQGWAWTENNTELRFEIPPGHLHLFREPTLLAKPDVPDGSRLRVGASHAIQSLSSPPTVSPGSLFIPSQWSASHYAANGVADNRHYIGFLAACGPIAWVGSVPKDGMASGKPASATQGILETTLASIPGGGAAVTYRLQYEDGSGHWVTYDEKFAPYAQAGSYGTRAVWTDENKVFNHDDKAPGSARDIIGTELGAGCVDPRTGRFGMQFIGPGGKRGAAEIEMPICRQSMVSTWASNGATRGAALKGAISQLALGTQRPDEHPGFSFSTWDGIEDGFGVNAGPTAPGWHPSCTRGIPKYGNGTGVVRPGMLCQNNPGEATRPADTLLVGTATQTINTSNANNGLNQYFADADGVIRRGMSAYVPTNALCSAAAPAAGIPSGLPLKTANDYSNGQSVHIENASRPLILNRPFRSVADLGYVFSDTPWRNLDCSTPESGSAALMDIFCIHENRDENGMTAGRVSLNTRQTPVLEAILAGAYRDEFDPAGTVLSGAAAHAIAAALCDRTGSGEPGKGPLANLSELAGSWNGPAAPDPIISGAAAYSGFSDDLANPDHGVLSDADRRVARFREASIRALANAGQTRVWNLMIDLVAQTGRYPHTAGSLDQFVVEGEQHWWVHLAIDRLTNRVIDRQVEVVKE